MIGIGTGKPVDWFDIEKLFADFQSSAFRLETRQQYSTGSEKEPFLRFLDGEILRSPALAEWHAEIGAGIRAGRTYSRVHVVTRPLSDYVRFECAWAYRANAAAGEDIRILAVDQGDWPQGLPHIDYWLFDSHRLLLMNYADEGSLLATELVDDPELVAAAVAWRGHALRQAVPFPEYDSQFDPFMRPR